MGWHVGSLSTCWRCTMWWHCLTRDHHHHSLYPAPAVKRTRCSCWNPGAPQQQMIIFENETKPQREGWKRLHSYLKSVRNQLLSHGLSPPLLLCKICFPAADPAPNDLHPEPQLACWCCRPKSCTGCVLACQGPSILGKHPVLFQKQPFFVEL